MITAEEEVSPMWKKHENHVSRTPEQKFSLLGSFKIIEQSMGYMCAEMVIPHKLWRPLVADVPRLLPCADFIDLFCCRIEMKDFGSSDAEAKPKGVTCE